MTLNGVATPIAIFLLSLSLSAKTFAQSFAETWEEGTTNFCGYSSNVEGDITVFSSFASEEQAWGELQKIMSFTGLSPNFIIKPADVPNAAATIAPDGITRVILYRRSWMEDLKNSTRTDWSATSVLAHEVGHHLNNHTFEGGGSNRPDELEADKFSGYVLARMGATLDEAQIAMRTISGTLGSSTHPPRDQRLEAIALGWYEANEGSSAPPPPSTVGKKKSPERETPNPASKPNNKKRLVEGLNYGIERITYDADCSGGGCNYLVEYEMWNETEHPIRIRFEVDAGYYVDCQAKYSNFVRTSTKRLAVSLHPNEVVRDQVLLTGLPNDPPFGCGGYRSKPRIMDAWFLD